MVKPIIKLNTITKQKQKKILNTTDTNKHTKKKLNFQYFILFFASFFLNYVILKTFISFIFIFWFFFSKLLLNLEIHFISYILVIF